MSNAIQITLLQHANTCQHVIRTTLTIKRKFNHSNHILKRVKNL
jgi:hypothetical protein